MSLFARPTRHLNSYYRDERPRIRESKHCYKCDERLPQLNLNPPIPHKPQVQLLKP